jgi:hypothetical protein
MSHSASGYKHHRAPVLAVARNDVLGNVAEVPPALSTWNGVI